jgi:hypothetical protein
MTTLDLKAAFFHVIDDHRWLAASGCAWNLAGPNSANGTKQEAHQLLPNIVVMILESLLLHARSLIDFYTKRQPPSTDILLCDFGLSIDRKLCGELAKYKNPIEVHLLHLTDWRDRDYRHSHAIGKDAKKARPDWNHDAILIVSLVFDALKDVSCQGSKWQKPFRRLHDASTERYQNKSSDWPAELGEKSNVEVYLKSLGL